MSASNLAIAPQEIDEKSSPSGWRTLPLGKISPLQRGFDLPTAKVGTGEVPIVYSNGVERFHNKAMVKGPGVVTGRSGTLGAVHFIENDFWPHNTSLWVTAFNGNAPKFIYYLYSFIGFQRFASGSGVPTLNRNDAHSFEVSLPSSADEQEAIAEALTDADALIASMETLIQKKRAIKQGAMQELLSGQRRLPGYAKPWGTDVLGKVCRSIVDGTHFTPRYVESGVPFYSVENVTANDFVNTKSISPEEHRILIRRCKPERGDILLTRIGAIGDTKLIDWDVDASIYVSLALLKCGDGIEPKFLHAYTKSKQFVRDLEERSLLNAAPRKINMGEIGKVKIPLPEPDEQRAIAEILDAMDADLMALESKLAKARQLKQGMMQDLLTGRVRLV